MGILILKGLTARRLYKSFGVKGLMLPDQNPATLQAAYCSVLFQCHVGAAICLEHVEPAGNLHINLGLLSLYTNVFYTTSSILGIESSCYINDGRY
jgi:hypothetical protein